MKAWILCAMLLLPLHAPKNPDRNNRQNSTQPNHRSTAELAISRSPIGKGRKSAHDQKTPEWYAAIQWSNWFLVGIAAITAWAVWRQAKESASATRTAEKNIAAFIESERAWLKAEKYRIDLPPLTDPMQPYPTYYVPVPIKNFGRTVAQVFDAAAYAALSPLPNVPECPTHPPRKTVIVPGESWNLPAPVPAGAVDSIRDETERRTLCIYGFVKYRDIGNDPRECWFCYFYHFRDSRDPTMPEGFYVYGNAPDAYTKCT